MVPTLKTIAVATMLLSMPTVILADATAVSMSVSFGDTGGSSRVTLGGPIGLGEISFSGATNLSMAAASGDANAIASSSATPYTTSATAAANDDAGSRLMMETNIRDGAYTTTISSISSAYTTNLTID